MNSQGKDTALFEREMGSIIPRYKRLLLTLVSNPPLSFGKALHGCLPEDGGVYRIFEKDSTWQSSLYVGEMRNLRNRIYTDHLMGDRQASSLKGKLIDSGQLGNEDAVKQYLQHRYLVQCVVITAGTLRTLFEHFAISMLKPKFND